MDLEIMAADQAWRFRAGLAHAAAVAVTGRNGGRMNRPNTPANAPKQW